MYHRFPGGCLRAIRRCRAGVAGSSRCLLIFAGRVSSGINQAELQRLWRRLQPLATDKMPLEVPPPRGSRFGSPLTLSRVHWVRPELVAEQVSRLDPAIIYCGRLSMKACAKISLRPRCAARGDDHAADFGTPF